MVGIELGEERIVILDVGDHGHVRVVLRARTDHRRPADVDVLDRGRVIRAARNRGFEGIEVHHEDIDRADPVLFHRMRVALLVAQRQQPAMDHRMKCLHPSVHHLGEAGDLGDVPHLEPRIAHGARRASRRDEFDAPLGEGAGEVLEPGLVGYGEQRAARADEVCHGMSRSGGIFGLVRVGTGRGEVANGDRGLFCLGEGPADAARILHRAAG